MSNPIQTSNQWIKQMNQIKYINWQSATNIVDCFSFWSLAPQISFMYQLLGAWLTNIVEYLSVWELLHRKSWNILYLWSSCIPEQKINRKLVIPMQNVWVFQLLGAWILKHIECFSCWQLLHPKSWNLWQLWEAKLPKAEAFTRIDDPPITLTPGPNKYNDLLTVV